MKLARSAEREEGGEIFVGVLYARLGGYILVLCPLDYVYCGGGCGRVNAKGYVGAGVG